MLYYLTLISIDEQYSFHKLLKILDFFYYFCGENFRLIVIDQLI